MSVRGHATPDDVAVHRLSWDDFDELARGGGGALVVLKLRRVERSRRLLLLRALVDKASSDPEMSGPLPPLEEAWDLLVRVQQESPAALELVLSHPYTGSWVGYATRVLGGHVDGICPKWVHAGHMHALAAAAAIHAGLEFRASVPVWEGGAILPTLGMIRSRARQSLSVVEIRAKYGRIEIVGEAGHFLLPPVLKEDAPGWWGIREIETKRGDCALLLRLDDLDPYRGPYGPMPPQRLDLVDVQIWHALVEDAWALIVDSLPDFASAFSVGFDSIVPWPTVAFRTPSASTEEAFGSAIIARPTDAASLAAILVHEFQHARLSGLLHLTQLHREDSDRYYYAPWRDDPRPLGGTLHGLVAFFGVSAFWRTLINVDSVYRRTAGFEFAYWRSATWKTLCTLRNDPNLTESGQRFVERLAEELGPWQDEVVSAALVSAAASDAADHYAGWRIRHIKPNVGTIEDLVCSWSTKCPTPPILEDSAPSFEQDGPWRHSRADLIRLSINEDSVAVQGEFPASWSAVPDATSADFSYVAGRFSEAAEGYRNELAENSNSPAAWIGLGLSLLGLGAHDASRALLTRPEIVRAMYRKLGDNAPRPEVLAEWFGRLLA